MWIGKHWAIPNISSFERLSNEYNQSICLIRTYRHHSGGCPAWDLTLWAITASCFVWASSGGPTLPSNYNNGCYVIRHFPCNLYIHWAPWLLSNSGMADWAILWCQHDLIESLGSRDGSFSGYLLIGAGASNSVGPERWWWRCGSCGAEILCPNTGDRGLEGDYLVQCLHAIKENVSGGTERDSVDWLSHGKDIS